jgi:hypothetical protein
MNYWLMVGAKNNWHIAFEHGNIWGLKETQRQRPLWEGLKEKDKVLFYATHPVAGIIGHGSIRTKFRQTNRCGLTKYVKIKLYGLFDLSLM